MRTEPPHNRDKRLLRCERELEAATRITSALFENLALDELVVKALQIAIEVVNAECGSILLANSPSKQLIFQYSIGAAAVPSGTSIPWDQGLAGTVFQSAKPIIIPDAQKDPRHHDSVGKMTGYLTRDLVTVPLKRWEGDPIGVLQVMNKRDGLLSEEDLVILTIVSAITASSIELHRTMAEKERIASELRIAGEIQKSILPRTFPPFPDRTDFDIYATTIPALEMGGDFYDFFLIDDKRLGVVMADVSGKGVPAAIFMAVSRSLLKATALTSVSPGECLEHVNRLLCQDNEAAMFVTVFYGILHTDTGELEFSNGGHHLPYVIHGNRVSPVGRPENVALGFLNEATYRTSRMSLEGGETLVLYTDGVTEAMDAQGQFFSEQRLEHTLQRLARQRPVDLLTTLVEDVQAFSRGAVQADDITLLALQYRRAVVQELTLANRLSEVERLISALARFGQDHRLPEYDVQAVTLALDEVITNTISYGYNDQVLHEIRVRLTLANSRLSAEVEDDARPFNPLTVPQPDLTSPLETRSVGGLGVHLMRSLMDQVDYRRESGRNRLIMSKRLSSVAQPDTKAESHGDH
jgi:sigma-B regulation protein RsbU (phosphoserine phosphatase)